MRTWRAREITIAVSLGLHGLIAAAALHSAHEKKQRRATTVAIADEKKKKVEPKKAEPPKPPPPKPAIAKASPRPAAAPAPAPVTAAPAPVAAAPLQTSISLGNEVGMETGAKTPDGGRPSDGAKPKPAAAGVRTPIRVAPPAAEQGGEACTEPPGKPEPATKTEIEYTEEARAAGIEGRLVLEVTVDADGNVTAVKVITGVDPALDAAAIATVKTWRFKPALACGKPVAGGTYKIARRFELGD